MMRKPVKLYVSQTVGAMNWSMRFLCPKQRPPNQLLLPTKKQYQKEQVTLCSCHNCPYLEQRIGGLWNTMMDASVSLSLSYVLCLSLSTPLALSVYFSVSVGLFVSLTNSCCLSVCLVLPISFRCQPLYLCVCISLFLLVLYAYMYICRSASLCICLFLSIFQCVSIS